MKFTLTTTKKAVSTNPTTSIISAKASATTTIKTMRTSTSPANTRETIAGI